MLFLKTTEKVQKPDFTCAVFFVLFCFLTNIPLFGIFQNIPEIEYVMIDDLI